MPQSRELNAEEMSMVRERSLAGETYSSALRNVAQQVADHTGLWIELPDLNQVVSPRRHRATPFGDLEALRFNETLMGVIRNAMPTRDTGPTITPGNNKITMNQETEASLKQKHLTKEERDAYHSPASDWEETPRGERCKSACTLDVSDVVVKFNKGSKARVRA